MTYDESYIGEYEPEPIRAASLFSTIRPGSRVTITTQHGAKLTGRCVMKFAGHAVLNLGGRYGTPGIADESNIVAVKPAKNRTYL